MAFTFTYKIKTISIEQGHFLVEYIPDDESLSPISLNVSIVEKDYMTIMDETTKDLAFNSQQAVPFSYHLEHTINYYSPQNIWKNQKYLLDNIELLQSKM
jgi:hypothetical protein